MATITAHAARSDVQPKFQEKGVYAIASTYSLTATPSAGDVILMAKIPAGVTVLSVQRSFNAGAGNDFIAQVGIEGATGSASAFATATGAAAVGWATKGVPFLVSVSDDATVRHAHLKITVGTVTSASATGSLSLVAYLSRDP